MTHRAVIRDVRMGIVPVWDPLMERPLPLDAWHYKACDACGAADPTCHPTRREASAFRLPCEEQPCS